MAEAYVSGVPGVEGKRKLRSAFSGVLTALHPAANPEKRAALIATSILLPAVASVLTVIIVLVEPPARLVWIYRLAPVWGTLGAVAAWLVLSRWCIGAADSQCAIPSSCGELLPRLDELETQLGGFQPAAGSPHPPCVSTAHDVALMQHKHIREDLKVKGLPWVLATGYIEAWDRLYRAEEAMIEFVPRSKVLESALYDEARLEGSEIPNRDDLLAKLRKAVLAVDPSAYKYLRSTATLTPPPALAIGTTALLGGTVGADYCTPVLAIGGVPPYKWAVIGGAIPDALVLNTAGVLHGTPTNAGHGGLTVQVTDSAGAAAERYFDLLISPPTQAPDVVFSTTTPLPLGTVDVKYNERLSATGGTPPYKWEKVKGTTPEGIPWSDEGVLEGTPRKEGTFPFEANVVDSKGKGSQSSREFTLVIKPAGTAAGVPPGGTEPELNARGVLRDVRHCINEYRNSRWTGLIVARNHLLATFTLTTMVVFALLAIAIMSGARREQIIAAIVFYLMGATVGLCNRLRSESQAESGVQDYGLSAARRITLPLFSGLGAIGGLLFVAYLPFASPVFAPEHGALAISTPSPLRPSATLKQTYRKPLEATGGIPPYSWKSVSDSLPGGLKLSSNGVLSGEPNIAGQPSFRIQVTDSAGSVASRTFTLVVADSSQGSQPQGGTQPKGTTGQVPSKPPENADDRDIKPTPDEKVLQRPPSLGDIFDLSTNLIGLFVAAVFGLAPGMLFDRLQQQADRYKADLKSSQPAEATPKS